MNAQNVFSGAEVANRVIGFDVSAINKFDIARLLKDLKGAYQIALDYYLSICDEDIETFRNPWSERALIPLDAIQSVTMQLCERVLDTKFIDGVLGFWLDDSRAGFDDQEFDGAEIQRWIDAKGLKSAHCFDGKAVLSPSEAATLPPVVPICDEKPWLLTDPQDPAPMQPWYTPARYFARQLAIEKPTLLRTRELLAQKVSTALFNAGYKKRGGKHKFGSGTVLKAFANVTLG